MSAAAVFVVVVAAAQLRVAHVHAAVVLDEAARALQGLLPGTTRMRRARMAAAVLRFAAGRRQAVRYACRVVGCGGGGLPRGNGLTPPPPHVLHI